MKKKTKMFFSILHFLVHDKATKMREIFHVVSMQNSCQPQRLRRRQQQKKSSDASMDTQRTKVVAVDNIRMKQPFHHKDLQKKMNTQMKQAKVHCAYLVENRMMFDLDQTYGKDLSSSCHYNPIPLLKGKV